MPYMVGKLAPNSSHLTRGLGKYVPSRSYFRAVPSPNGDKLVISPPPPIVERVRPTECFNDWGGRGYEDSVPRKVTKTTPFGDRTT